MEDQFYSETKVSINLDQNDFSKEEIESLAKYFHLNKGNSHFFVKKENGFNSIKINNSQTRVHFKNNSTDWLLSKFDKQDPSQNKISLSPISIIKKNLEKHSFLKKFKKHIIIFHPKGKSIIYYYVLEKNKISAEKLSLKEFNTLFSHIKKSRNKVFDGSNKNLFPAKIVGNFLAKEVQANDFTAIFISTDNFIIPADKTEFVSFYESFNEIRPCLVFGIRQLLAINKNKAEKTALDSININPEQDNNFLSSSEAIHQEKMKLLGDLLNTLRHELSNPIFGLKLASETLADADFDEETQEYIEQVIQCVDNSQQVITNFSNLYENVEHKEIYIHALLKKILTLTKSATRNIRFEFENNTDENLKIKTNPTYLIQPIFNIIINAAQAIEGADTQNPIVTLKIVEDDDSISITITDNGPGIDPLLSEKLFSPFVTSKETGTGLGLAISKSLIQKIGGTLSHDPLYTSGARFLINLKKDNL